ncbi:hypothetical protein K458DRAFT_247109, partial [Lentithecium fluviatile CBS 122367]
LPRTLEVERKFMPTPSSIATLRANTGHPPFTTHTPLGHTKFRDVYFDKSNVLLSNGIYIRTRDDIWEAKVRYLPSPSSGSNPTSTYPNDFVNSAMLETTDTRRIAEIVDKAFRRHTGTQYVMELADLTPVAMLRTSREAWDVEGFRVVVDETDFGHVVGEVELCLLGESRGGKGGEGEKEEKDWQRNTEEMNKRIEEFMKAHAWAFPMGDGGKVVGKLSAYFAWK